MKELAKYLKKYKKDIYKVIIVLVFVAITNAAIPSVVGQLTDAVGSAQESVPKIKIASLLIIGVGLTFASIFMNRYVNKKRARIAEACSLDLTVSAYSHLVKLPLYVHKDKKIGEISHMISRGGLSLSDIVNRVLFPTITDIFTVAAILAMLYMINFKLVAVALALVIVYVFAAMAKAKDIMAAEERYSKTVNKVSGEVFDSINNVEMIKSYTAEKREGEKYKSGYQKVFNDFCIVADKWANLVFLQGGSAGFGFWALFGMAIWLVFTKEITFGQLLVVYIYTGMIARPFSTLSENYFFTNKAMVNIAQVESLLKESAEPYNDGLRLEKDIKQWNVEFKNVYFRHRNKKEVLIKDINIPIKTGKKIALVGRSGSGKSTIADILQRLVDESHLAGDVSLNGIDIHEINVTDLREFIVARVPQNVRLINNTILENIRFAAPKATMEEINVVAKLIGADEFINRLPYRYEHIVGKDGQKLSGGERQYVALIQALLLKPKILILDEPIASMDSISADKIKQALSKLPKSVTIIIISHNLHVVKDFVDDIYVLENGEITGRGTHEWLRENNSLYRKLCILQNIEN